VRRTLGVCLLVSLLAGQPFAYGADRSVAAQWGDETLAAIEKSFAMPERSLYALEIGAGVKKPRPGWIWDASVQLGALSAAARLDPKTYLPHVRAYAVALRSYRTIHNNRPGLDVNPPPKPSDRYYDDNAWISYALLEAYELTRDPKDLALALDAYRFTMSGEDDAQGGGIYWHEDRPTSKNACSSGPAMLAALKLHALTGEQAYLDTAKRLYDWTRKHLQDEKGLVSDSVAIPAGKIDGAKYTYNSATLLRAACILHRVTRDKAYLDEAQRIAHAAEKRFIRASDGVITGSGKLAVKLVEAFLELYETDHDDHWRQVVGKSLTALHQHRNADGWYAQDWQAPPPSDAKPIRLIDQSAAARAYWIAAEHGVEVRP
jgi:mannose/cellobiose epimerase-like protein (N-acyl-D-glucosamine 2-epimerase family)